MKSDAWFYRAFRDFPKPFFDMLKLPPELIRSYRFEAAELKDVAVRIDGAYRPVLPGHPHIFLEAQLYRDEAFYPKWFAKIFLDLSRQPAHTDWKALVIFANRGDDEDEIRPWLAPWVDEGRVQRVYLEELPDFPVASPEVAVLKLVTVSKSDLLDKASQLARQVRQFPDQPTVALQLLEALLVSNFPNMTREEIQTMLQLHDIRESRIFQEGLEEGKIEQLRESISKLQAKGRTEQEIADLLDLSLETVRQAMQRKPVAE